MLREILISRNEFNRLSYTQKISYLLDLGTKAPSTHNTQPWIFKQHETSVDILPDLSKRLPYADPTNRCLYISLGCCIENILQAANYYGIENEAAISKVESNPNVRITFGALEKGKPTNSDVAETILKRKNSRGEYNSRKISIRLLNELLDVRINEDVKLDVVVDEKRKGILTDLTVTGTILASTHRGFRNEMSQWIIPNHSQRRDGMPGYSLNIPDVLSPLLPFVVRTFNLGRLTAKKVKRNFSSASALIIISAKDNSCKNWIDSGRLAELAMLTLQSKGLSTSISAAAIEMNLLNSRNLKKLKIDSHPQLIFSVGYKNSTEVRYSPRHPSVSKIML